MGIETANKSFELARRGPSLAEDGNRDERVRTVNPSEVEVLSVTENPIEGVQDLPHFQGVNVFFQPPLVLKEKLPAPPGTRHRLSSLLLTFHQMPCNEFDIRASMVGTLEEHLVQVLQGPMKRAPTNSLTVV